MTEETRDRVNGDGGEVFTCSGCSEQGKLGAAGGAGAAAAGGAAGGAGVQKTKAKGGGAAGAGAAPPSAKRAAGEQLAEETETPATRAAKRRRLAPSPSPSQEPQEPLLRSFDQVMAALKELDQRFEDADNELSKDQYEHEKQKIFGSMEIK